MTLKEFAKIGRFVVVSLVSFSLSQAHVIEAHASDTALDLQRSVRSQNTPTTDLKNIVKLPYTAPVITSHKTFNFEVQPSSPSVPPHTPVKGATSPVTGLPVDVIAIEGGVLAATGAGLMLYGRRKKSSRKSSKEE